MTGEKVTTLETERLRLRAFEEADRAALFSFQMDPAVMRTFGGGVALTAAEAEQVLQYHIACRAYPYWAWAVALREDDVCFGQLTAGWIERDGEKWIEMGWILRKDMWGKGYGTEALRAVLRHGVGELKWPRVMAGAWVENPASRRIMEKAGMKWAGQEVSVHGRMWDRFVVPAGWGGAG